MTGFRQIGISSNVQLVESGKVAQMATVTISAKFQVVIPRIIRDSLRLKPGQKLQAILCEDRIELIPVRPMRKMRGFLPGLDTTVARAKDRM